MCWTCSASAIVSPRIKDLQDQKGNDNDNVLQIAARSGLLIV